MAAPHTLDVIVQVRILAAELRASPLRLAGSGRALRLLIWPTSTARSSSRQATPTRRRQTAFPVKPLVGEGRADEWKLRRRDVLPEVVIVAALREMYHLRVRQPVTERPYPGRERVVLAAVDAYPQATELAGAPDHVVPRPLRRGVEGDLFFTCAMFATPVLGHYLAGVLGKTDHTAAA